MKKVLSICFWALLLAFTIYVAMDTFVIRKAYTTNTSQINTDLFADATASSVSTHNGSVIVSAHATGNTFAETAGTAGQTIVPADEKADSATEASTEPYSITLNEYYEYGTSIYVADVTLSSVQYLKTAFADDTYGRNITEKTSEIAAANGAVLAINGDYYGAQESGYVIRNGVIYRDSGNSKDILCIYTDGSVSIEHASEKSAQELLDAGVWQAFCFGPALVEDSEIAVSVNEEVGKAKASNPRTAIGIIDNNHFVFVVSDGRTSESEGLSLYELAAFMQDLGVTTAYNLDGGGSSTMYYNGQVINNPTTNGNIISERSVSDIVYIG